MVGESKKMRSKESEHCLQTMGSCWRDALMLRGRASPSSLSAPTCSLPTSYLLAGFVGAPAAEPPVPLPPAATADARASGGRRSHESRRVPHFTTAQPGPPPPAGTGGVRKGAVWTSSPSNRLHAPAFPAERLQAPECTAPAVRRRAPRPGSRLPAMPPRDL